MEDIKNTLRSLGEKIKNSLSSLGSQFTSIGQMRDSGGRFSKIGRPSGSFGSKK